MRSVCYQLLIVVIIGIFPACDQKDQSNKYDNLDQRTKIRLRQYRAEGRRLYNLHCANCHQIDGAGLASLYPPLKQSDYMISNRIESICGIRNGQRGEIFVNGISYNVEMPSNINFTDIEVAEIATYIYTEFTDTVQIITINEVRAIMDSCKQVSMQNQ